MKKRKYSTLLYFISLVVLVTLSIQIYWNLKNYHSEKQRLINDIQISLDNAVDNYYASLAQRNTIGFFADQMSSHSGALTDKMDSLLKRMKISNKGFKGFDSITVKRAPGIFIIKGKQSIDSFKQTFDSNSLKYEFKIQDSVRQDFSKAKAEFDRKLKLVDSLTNRHPVDSTIQLRAKALRDSILGKPISSNTTQTIISFTTDTIELKVIDSLFQKELMRKSLNINYGLWLRVPDKPSQMTNSYYISDEYLKASSSSNLLPENSSLEVYFTNIIFTLFKRNLVGILLSTLLVASVIACLLFLLNIINRQKQLAEVKNDLISNITHEFKTPIATISVALEGIKNFNRENDPVKTNNYVNTSTTQLNKLSMMVEKLLETATLDGDDLSLNKEEVNLNDLLQSLIYKHQTLATGKKISFNQIDGDVIVNGDPFHLENAFNNLLDNAVKYGGESIQVELENLSAQIEIQVTDSGKSLSNAEAKQIFEKFYRVPKGNTHDVKGFGIGLYYTRKIIEKHGGNIIVTTSPQTTFKIELPHGY